ncbi:hypothetical protein SAMN05216359_110147 [Roseateles sp. YR242]|uniref:preATP grasp domain-containing protein n=1 Tax=Roseateles sp. YR242 TaxID=1855305 RepID=UPI0008AC4918|nr:hypothetical protein [Roseateles sp. YR242]SEL52251.1 hypothetical protein SAMN05216359_110147 [Roseateles sp. YR242]
MPKILIINVGATHALRPVRQGSDPLARATAKHLWMADNDDVVIYSGTLENAFIDYVFGITRVDRNRVRLVQVDGVLDDAALDACDLDPSTLQGYAINACYMSPAVARLQQRLTPSRASQAQTFAASAGADLFNRKADFRRLASGFGLPIPPGEILLPGADPAAAVQRLLGLTGALILKSNSGAGGEGNYGITLAARRMTGVRASRTVANLREAQDAARAFTAELREDSVIEAYLPSTEEFYLEYLIAGEGEVSYLNSGRVLYKGGRPDSGWCGLELPYGTREHLAQARELAAPFMAHAARIGYRGYINLDAIVTGGQVRFNETNARWGGGTAGHELFVRLHGQGHSAEKTLRSVRDIPALPFPAARRRLEEDGLLLSGDRHCGVVLLSGGGHPGDVIELLLAGNDPVHVDELEVRVRKAFRGITN